MFNRKELEARISTMATEASSLRARLSDAVFAKNKWMRMYEALCISSGADLDNARRDKQALQAAYNAVVDQLGEVQHELDRTQEALARRDQANAQLGLQLQTTSRALMDAAEIARDLKQESDELANAVVDLRAKVHRAESQRNYARELADGAMERKEAVMIANGDVVVAQQIVEFVNPPKQAKPKKRKKS